MPKTPTSNRRKPANKPSPRKKRPALTARTADRYALYQGSVQDPDSELEFLEKVCREFKRPRPTLIREDFCGTALIAATWVKRRRGNRAIGVDLHRDTVRVQSKRNTKDLTDEQRSRLTLLCDNVLSPKLVSGPKVEAVLALNFSYWVFKQREAMLDYFTKVRRALRPGGVFILDHLGGSDVQVEMRERTRFGGFTYVWDQAEYDPISGDYLCRIHFEFRDGTRLTNAFTYHWRMWSMPELRDVLHEAGFGKVAVYWEGDDGKGGGNGVFRAKARGEACRSHISYLVASVR